MVEAHNKIVSIETFRAARLADRSTAATSLGPVNVRPQPSPRSIEHRERMLRFLRMEAMEAQQGRLLL
jgi:hypothetical protein